MTQLTNQTPEATYGDLLTTTNNGQGLPPSTPVPVQDGLGNNSPITMSQTVVSINNQTATLNIGGSQLTATGSQLNKVTSGFLSVGEIITTNNFTTILTLNVTNFIVIELAFSAFYEPLEHFAVSPTRAIVMVFNGGAGLAITGTTSGALTNSGLSSPQFQVITSGTQLLVQVKELNSATNNTAWTCYYNILEDL